MHEEMRTFLNAYLDGELHGRRLQEMENHLATCDDCRNELMELRLVSELLQAAPAPEVIPAERFVAQLMMSLPRSVQFAKRIEPGNPRRTLRNQAPKPGSLAWWLVPAGLLGAWFFVQTVFTLTDVVTAAKLTGVLGQAASWLGSNSQETIWFRSATSLFSGQAAGSLPTLSLLNNVSIFAANLLGGFLWQAVIVLVYWAWLLFWWLRSSPRPVRMWNAS